MAIRLNPNVKALAVIGGIILLVLLLVLMVAALLATGCAAAKVDEVKAEVEAEAAVVKVSDESASPTTTAGDDATITNVNVGTGIGCIALLPLLGLLIRRYRTVVGALDRVVNAIDTERHVAFDTALPPFRSLKKRIREDGLDVDAVGGQCTDGVGTFLHARLVKLGLARLKK